MTILHLHRRGLFLLERARVHLDEGRVVYSAAADGDEGRALRSWNVPSLNTSALLLGQGTSLTQPAVRRLQEDGVSVAFVGSNGTPFLMASQDYRPGDRLQAWIARWPSVEWRLRASKRLQAHRRRAVLACWGAYRKEEAGRFRADPRDDCEEFEERSEKATCVVQLMGVEGAFMKSLYKRAARAVGTTWVSRASGEGTDRANRFLDHGNYLAYGLASAVLWAYGIPTSLPVTHGATRAGGLVFDIPDAVKDAIVLPTAFQCTADPDCTDQEFRDRVTERLHGATCLDGNGTLGHLFRVVDDMLAIPAEGTLS